MIIRELLPEEQSAYDALVDHPLQSWAWGEARKATGHQILRLGIFANQKLVKAWLMTCHPIPKLNKLILYYPRGPLPDEQMTQVINSESRKLNTVFVKIEPNVFTELSTENQDLASSSLHTDHQRLLQLGYRPGRHLFTPYNFLINLSLSENQLLANMKPKTRYNVRVAEKKGVSVIEDNSELAFATYLELLSATTSRQKFYAHDAQYHQQIWATMSAAGIAHLLTARYQNQILTAWILFKWKDKLYYPYGASSREHKEVMTNNLMMWEAMKFGKSQGCTTFDLWGTAGLNPQPTDLWYGFHHFKLGYGPQVVKYLGAYDYVIDPMLYPIVTRLDTARRWLLKVKTAFLPNTFE